MRLVVDFDELPDADLRILLRGREAGVAKHFLDGAQVRALAQKVGGESVAQRMRTDADESGM